MPKKRVRKAVIKGGMSIRGFTSNFLPFTSTLAFTIASLGLIGVPMTAGYLTKKYLEAGAKSAGDR